MEKMKVIFTKRNWNPGSYLIRWGLPKSRFKVAPMSHCLIVDGDYLIEANMEHGVRRVLAADGLKSLTIVAEVEYNVPDLAAGIEYARSQVGKPYDFKGAFGLALAPDRDWTAEDKWFCFELAAAALAKAGRNDFRDDAGHITGNLLLAIKP